MFGRWWESAIFLERKGEEEDNQASIQAHHREQKGVGKMSLQVDIDDANEDDFNITFIDDQTDHRPRQLEDDVLEAIEEAVKDRPEGAPLQPILKSLELLEVEYKTVLSVAKGNGFINEKLPVGFNGKVVWALRRGES